MNPQEIKEFLKSIKNTDIEELQYQRGGDSLYFKKTSVESITPVGKEIAIDEDKKEEKKSSLVTIKSTMVGTFTSAQSDDKSPFVEVGNDIVVGQKIGQIEAMKIIKDINSNTKGKILKILVSNGQPVEYGQELLLVDTSK